MNPRYIYYRKNVRGMLDGGIYVRMCPMVLKASVEWVTKMVYDLYES